MKWGEIVQNEMKWGRGSAMGMGWNGMGWDGVEWGHLSQSAVGSLVLLGELVQCLQLLLALVPVAALRWRQCFDLCLEALGLGVQVSEEQFVHVRRFGVAANRGEP